LQVKNVLEGKIKMPGVNSKIYETIYRLPVGTQFTNPEIREKVPGKVMSKHVSTSLSYLCIKGFLKKVNKWDGTNLIVYEVVDPTKKIGYTPGIGLLGYRNKNSKSNRSVSELLTTIEGLFTKVLEHNTAVPATTLSNFSTEELLNEISNRTRSAAQTK
jgi:hypothetical protein